MIYKLNEGVLYVKGFYNGAIYNLNTKNVFSINKVACNIIEKLINRNEKFDELEKKYIDLLKENDLYKDNFKIELYNTSTEYENKFDTVWLELTQNCNMKCIHCYEGESHFPSSKQLNILEWKNIIDQLKELKVNRVIVIGGEPCTYIGVFEILKYLSENNINTTLFTNASLLNKKIMDYSIENNIEIKISLYGSNSLIHDNITKVKGSFDILIKNIKYLVSKGKEPTIAITLMKENENDYEEINKLINNLGIKKYKFDVIREVADGKQSNHTPENIEIKKLVLRTEPSFKTSKNLFERNNYKNSCWYGKLVITENGDLIPCVFARSFLLGNIFEQSLKDLLTSDKLNKYWGISLNKIKDCSICEFRFACNDCRPIAYVKNKNILEKNPRCLYNPYTGEWNNEKL